MFKVRKYFFVFLLLNFVLSLSFFALKRTQGFSTYKLYKLRAEIEKPLHYSEGEIDEMRSVFSQPFNYLNKGRQCFVFESKDHKYVLKLLNKNHLYFPKILKKLPFVDSIVKRRNERKKYVLDSFFLAWQKLKDQSKICYLNQNRNVFKENKVKLVFNYGLSKEIDLNDYFFVVQKRAELIYPKIHEIYKKNGIEEVLEIADRFLEFVAFRVQNNIVDEDMDVEINYGFCQDELMLIDTGRLRKKDLSSESEFSKELFKSTKKFRKWLVQNYPEVIESWDDKIQKIVQNQFSLKK